MNYDKLPDVLKKQDCFCLWKIEHRNGKKTKVPYQINGARARPNDLKTFSSFADVMAVYLKGGYDGIGLLNKKLVGIDVDDCVLDDGTLNDLGTDVVNALDSYTERSPSGKGIRVWVIANHIQYDKAKYYINNRKLHLEVYVPSTTQHFLTLTGNVIRDMNFMERSTELQNVLDKYMVRPDAGKIRAPVIAPGSILTDDEIIEVILRSANAEKFKALFYGSALNEPGADHSALDLALCRILAFYCRGDKAQIDRLFCKSALVRDKWDSRRGDGTYGSMTIDKAVNACTEFYEPFRKASVLDDFDEVLIKICEMQPEQNPRYRDGDLGYGRLFADVYKGILAYVPERKKWYWYDGKRWIPDEGNLRAMELCKDLADALLKYALQISNEDIRTNFLKSTVQKWQKRAFRETYLKEAQSIYPVYMSEFDTNKYLFNCSNGTLDLSTMEFKEHNPADRITKLTQVVYDPSADSIRFKEFIDEIMSGDADKASYLQKALGYAISGDTRFECMFFLYGETTRNGKELSWKAFFVSWEITEKP